MLKPVCRHNIILFDKPLHNFPGKTRMSLEIVLTQMPHFYPKDQLQDLHTRKETVRHYISSLGDHVT